MDEKEFWNKFFDKMGEHGGRVTVKLKDGRILKIKGAGQHFDNDEEVYFIVVINIKHSFSYYVYSSIF